ncbi:hypothetical protein DFP72DRAFT_822902 [Ephemerocybe angulata]|uniref:SAM domain-containing protein n=1 Tax=Ephemerocybe angulata TaxID=980116 RepID=A0A8H6HHU9_9AGAR|nr:hypothetical protein DFP72DRAFT_822902 [Tulosesus angulatus]
MSDSENDNPPCKVVSKVTFYKPSSASNGAKSKKSGAKKAMKKDLKTKEFEYEFEASDENYYAFLKVILDKHGVTGYRVGKGSVYAMKMQVPPANKGDACDVEDLAEYRECVTSKITDKMFSKAVTVYVDINDVKTALKKVSSDEDGLTPQERELARYRGLLADKYKNDRDGTLTYTDPTTGENVPLTIAMQKEWARAMYDAKATVDDPPNTAPFDAVNRRVRIKQSAPASSSGSSNASGTGLDVAAQAFGAISSVMATFGSIINPKANQPRPVTPTPSSHAQNDLQLHDNHPNSPMQNTPTKLRRFLAYAEKVYGAQDVSDHRYALEAEGYGPDILQDIPNEDLKKLGINSGNVIRLKRAAPAWWSIEKLQPKKRAFDDAFGGDDAGGDDAGGDDRGAQKRRKLSIQFEKRWFDPKVTNPGPGNDGLLGSARMNGSGFTEGRLRDDVDFQWYYFSDEVQAVVPIPPGFVPILDDGDSGIDDEGQFPNEQ